MLPGTVEALKRRRRRSVLPRTRGSRTLTSVIAVILIAASIGTAVVLSGRNTGVPTALVNAVRAERISPLAMIESGGQTHPFVFLSDVPGSADAKMLAADAAERLARSGQLDLLAVEAPSDEQPYLDRYLNTKPENAAVLMARPRLLGPSSSAQSMLALYRRIWKLNDELGSDRQVRIAAIDVPGWPPNVQRPRQTASLYAERDRAMFDNLQKLLARTPNTRVMFLLSSYHVLRNGRLTLEYAGGQPVHVESLATLVAQAYPGQVFSVLVDAPLLNASGGAVGTTKFFDLLRRGVPELPAPFALPVSATFDDVREPIFEHAVSGVKVDIEPDNYNLRDVVDGYIYMGFARRNRPAQPAKP